ncbi:anti-anti-sigma factor [Xylophilus sp. Kf1]|nr:anti-anti-sigma factor [Xylophilus sp. Kf1]
MNPQRSSSAFPDDRISALADGALPTDEISAALDRLTHDDEALAQWHCYHLVGDALRSQDLGDGRGDLDFLKRLEMRLALEPVFVPKPDRAVLIGQVAAPIRQPAANGDTFRWKMVAGFASLAAVAAIGWQSLQMQLPSGTGAGAVMAQGGSGAAASGFQPASLDASSSPAAEVAMSTVGNPPVMLRNAQLDELLAAHNRAVGGAALQSQVRLLRNVSVTEDFSR